MSCDSDICLRKGKWTVEEENYANFIIDMFNQGRLPISEGTTLRAYLSEKLKCDPMRITKKYAGESSIGKQIFHSDSIFFRNIEEVAMMNEKLNGLERAFLKKIHSKYSSTKSLSSDNVASRSSQRGQRQREKPADYSDYYTADKLDSLDIFEDVQHRKIHRKESFPSDEDNERLHSHRFQHNKELQSFSHGFNRSQNMYDTETLQSQIITTMQIGQSYSKRSVSTPNLSSLEAQIALRNSQYMSLLPNVASNPLKIALANDSFHDNAMSLSDQLTNRKRSHSSMALVEFDKLVRDDDAADSLFMEFVSTVQDMKRVRSHRQFQQHQSDVDNYSWARSSSATKDSEISTLALHTVTPTVSTPHLVPVGFKTDTNMSSTTEKIFDSCKAPEIVIDSFHANSSRENSDLQLHLLVHQSKDQQQLDLRQNHVVSSDDESGNFF